MKTRLLAVPQDGHEGEEIERSERNGKKQEAEKVKNQFVGLNYWGSTGLSHDSHCYLLYF